MTKFAKVYVLNDGFKDVGIGFICPYCEHHNDVFCEELEEIVECEDCNENSITRAAAEIGKAMG